MKKNKKYFSIFVALVVAIIVSFSFYIKPLLGNLNLGLDLQGGFEILYEVKPLNGDGEVTSDMVKQTYKTLLKRVDVLGVSEPKIEIEGNNRIRVQLAGVTNQEEARNILSKMANLTFRDSSDNLLMSADVLREGGAKLSGDQFGNPAVSLGIKNTDKFYEVTDKVSKSTDQLIVIWLDFEEGVDSYKAEASKPKGEQKFLSAARVSQAFSSDVQITGGFEKEEAQQLADLINSGSLPTKLNEIYETSVGASLGENSLSKTITAGVIGIAAIFIFMISIYRFAGVISSISLLVYVSLVFLLFFLVGGTLTLPGIAAMLIGTGMAVDANVITFERIKEELLKGRTLQGAFKEGNKRSFTTIFDSNITTFLVASILYIFGESSVKGFATMLVISIFVTFMVTVYFTRFLLGLCVKSDVFNDKLKLFVGVNPKDIPDLRKNETPKPHRFNTLDFVGNRKKFYAFSGIVIGLGIICMFIFNFNLGIDFTSGTNITVNSENIEIVKEDVYKEFDELGFKVKQFTLANENTTFSVRLKEDLDKEQVIKVKTYLTEKYGAEPNMSVVSPVVGRELTKNAFISMILASIGIAIYLTFRFRSSFAYAGLIALIHDGLFVLAVFSIFRLEINGVFVAAILSILGYSINDSIIAFDRIRENTQIFFKGKIEKPEDFDYLANVSLQQTFVRSIYTTCTTLIPVISLLIFGSRDVFDFNIALLVGLFIGAYSSLFIASQLWLTIERRNFIKPKKDKKKWIDMDDEPKELNIKGINS